jgi:membrane protease YdiL (CAAX protease family)
MPLNQLAANQHKLRDLLSLDPWRIYTTVRGRSLIGLFLLATIIPVLGDIFFFPDFSETSQPLPDANFSAVIFLLLACFLWIACVRAKITTEIHFGARPSSSEIKLFVLIAFPLIGISIGGVYLFYLPISFIWPDFVTSWFLEAPPILWWSTHPDLIMTNFINAILLVILAPFIEEVFFRGFLFNRWHRKYGAGKAMIFSSLLFALLHTDLVGAFIFGLVMCLIYLKTKSLVGAIITHAANNLIVLLITLVYAAHYDGITIPTMDEFRKYWWLAAILTVISIPLLIWFKNSFLLSNLPAMARTR